MAGDTSRESGKLLPQDVSRLRKEAGDALSALLRATSRSEEEIKKRRKRGLPEKDGISRIELADRDGMGRNAAVKLSRYMGTAETLPTARITPDEMLLILNVTAQFVLDDDSPEAQAYDAAAARFRDAVNASQKAWDQYEVERTMRAVTRASRNGDGRGHR